MLRVRTQIDMLEGTDRLQQIRWGQIESGKAETRPIRHLFFMTGADPNKSSYRRWGRMAPARGAHG